MFPIDDFDLLIASTAPTKNSILVTNMKAFCQIKD
jgi:predicted nucleic acid-binding protein